MKYNKLRPYKLLALGMLLAMAGCTKDDAPADGQGAEQPVEFEASTSLFQTRSIINGTGDLQNFGVFAYYTGTYAWNEWTKQAPNFMNNQRGSKRGS